MNVKQLREALEQYPDDAYVCSYDTLDNVRYAQRPFSLCNATVIADNGFTEHNYDLVVVIN